ncbi:MAG TPA: hypothetical protein VFV69_11110 [Steroidobacteraceae bacterium]|jgi:hypothetical protein|nr:hypothetical protein [Steroidobacteraceae bacterium]
MAGILTTRVAIFAAHVGRGGGAKLQALWPDEQRMMDARVESGMYIAVPEPKIVRLVNSMPARGVYPSTRLNEIWVLEVPDDATRPSTESRAGPFRIASARLVGTQ